MAKKIANLTFREVDIMAGNDHGEYLGKDLMMAMSVSRLGRIFLQTGQPYRIDDGRIIRVTSGEARSIINMEPHDLTIGTILVVPPDSVFEIERMEDTFDMQFITFRDFPAKLTFESCVELHLCDDDWNLIGEYFHLLSYVVSREPLNLLSVRDLISAMLHELQVIHDKEEAGKKKSQTRQQEIFHQFAALLNEHAATEHEIAFYADKLCLTPNHLGATIREATGTTVMQWIHRYIIQQAKLQLKYSNKPIWQIAESLNFPNPSFFSKFFKRETCMTPGEYRKGM